MFCFVLEHGGGSCPPRTKVLYTPLIGVSDPRQWSYLCWVLLWPVVQAFPQEVPSLPYLSCSNVSCNSSVNTLNLDYIANLRQYVICLANI